MEHETFRGYVEDMRFRKLLERTIREDVNKHIINGYFDRDNHGNLIWIKQRRN